MLYNIHVRYKNRLYTDFNVSMKRIRLRDTITSIMASPDVYLRSKVSQEMYDTFQKVAEIRKLDRMNLVRDFNLFPIPVNLFTLERKYGDALSYEDIHGCKQKRKRRKTLSKASITEQGTMKDEQSLFLTPSISRIDLLSDGTKSKYPQTED